MSELPPDPVRLRAILAHLDNQVAQNETVGIYLRLQREAVQAALARAEAPAQRHPGRLPKGALPLRSMGVVATHSRPEFVVQRNRTPRGLQPSIIHLGDCAMIEGSAHPITEHDARVSLTDPSIEACQFCRPDTELGIDVA